MTSTTVRTSSAPSAPSTARAPRTRRRARSLGKAALGLIGVVVAIIWIFPVYWMMNSSMLPNVVLQSRTPTFFPVGGSWDNFAAVIGGGTFLPALGMSVVVALIVVICCLFFAFLAALAISRFRFKGRTSFILAVLFIQMLPAEGLFIAQYKLMASVHLLNTVLGISILYVAAVVPFTIWMLRGFVAGIPAELEEAAMVDGLSRTQAFLRITFPLLAPGLVAAGVYTFLQSWNEFTVALVVLQNNADQTLPLWLRSFVQTSVSKSIDWGQVMAASTLVALPVIIFFLFVQNKMTSGLVSGAVKG